MKFINNEDGVSLIELIASIAIVTLLLISFAQLFIQANKTAAYNNEKLVTINLADGALARLQSETFTKKTNITNVNDYFVEPATISPAKRRIPTTIQMNGKTYSVSYKASQSTENFNRSMSSNNSTNQPFSTEKNLDLIKVVVTVTSPDGKMKSSTEGYVVLE
ncbi:MAG: type II secretory pathway protein [Lysinibacillus sp.]